MCERTVSRRNDWHSTQGVVFPVFALTTGNRYQTYCCSCAQCRPACRYVCLLVSYVCRAGKYPPSSPGVPSAWPLHFQPSVWPDGRFFGKICLIFNSRCATRMLVNILQHSVFTNLSESLYMKEPKARHRQVRSECLAVL